MPAYDYKCPKCQLIMAFIHKTNELLSPHCLTCDMVKTIGYSAINFKGSGFYETDYKVK